MEQFPPSPFSTALADSDEEQNTHILHGFSPDRFFGSPVGGSSTWSSPSMADRRRRRRTVGLYPACRGKETMTGADVSSQHCHEPLPTAVGLTPPDAGQKECNGPLCLDMQPVDMAEPRTFCPSQQQRLFMEVDVEDTPQTVFKNSNNLWAKQDEPSVISPETSPLVKHGSNLTPPYQRNFAAEEGEVSDQTLGLVTKSPIKKGIKPSSTLKVYVRRKEWGAVNHETHVQCSPHSCHNGKKLVSQNSINENSMTDELKGRDIHISDPEGLTPKLQCPPHSPAPNSSFNKDYLDNEEALHMEIVRHLRVSYVENNNSNDNMMKEANISSGFNAPADVMGMKHFES